MKFKVGDRVAFYDGGQRETGTVESVFLDNSLNASVDGDESRIPALHPKQCRLLKKKERRRIKVEFGLCGSCKYMDSLGANNRFKEGELVEFIEVKRK